MPLIIAFIVLVILIVFLKSPHGKGLIGEYIIRFNLGKTKQGEKYIINDLILKGENGKTSQIDHILINENGVFVIETKNYSGRIYGNESQLQWTQVLNYGKIKNRIYNPIKQNDTHIYRLRELVDVSFPIKSIIVFVQGNTRYINSDKVYTIEQMREQIKKKQKRTLTEKEMEELYEKIIYLKESNTTTLKEHIKNSNQTIIETEKGICPRCGNKLIKRNSKYGTFYGCSNYPKCRFTKK